MRFLQILATFVALFAFSTSHPKESQGKSVTKQQDTATVTLKETLTVTQTFLSTVTTKATPKASKSKDAKAESSSPAAKGKDAEPTDKKPEGNSTVDPVLQQLIDITQRKCIAGRPEHEGYQCAGSPLGWRTCGPGADGNILICQPYAPERGNPYWFIDEKCPHTSEGGGCKDCTCLYGDGRKPF